MKLPVTEPGVTVGGDPLIGAACTLGAEELRERLAAWRTLRGMALTLEDAGDRIRLVFPVEHPMTEIVRLAADESACCPFYRFSLVIDGPRRELEISAGAGRLLAVRALLGLPD